MIKTSIVIPHWNGENILKGCLLSIKNSSYQEYEVIIIDNGSTDHSIQIAKKILPEIKVIKFKDNYGFAKAVNEGIKLSTGEYIFLLNNDTELDKECLKRLVDTLNRKPEVYGVTPKTINFFDRETIESTGDEINIVGQPFPRGKGDPEYKWDRSGEVYLITAGGSVFRKKAFTEIGLFDESFFAYYEDVDWCLRAQLMELKFWYESKAILFHEGKATSKNNNKFLQFLLFKNWMQLIIKDFPWQLFFKKFRWIKIPLVHFHTLFFFAQKKLFKEAILANCWIISHFLPLLIKRIKIQKRRKANLKYLDNKMLDKKSLWFSTADKQ